MNELALFAGVGGGLLASRSLGWRTICAVERDRHCIETLLARQNDHSLEPFEIWDDITTFDGRPWRDLIDVITAGFPCQPWSQAGRRRREGDERNMWPDTFRTILDVRPRCLFLENVVGLLSGPQQRVFWHTIDRTLFGSVRERHSALIRVLPYVADIFGQLADEGFDAAWEVVSAREAGAPHIRRRLWVWAEHPDTNRGRLPKFEERNVVIEDGQGRDDVERFCLAYP